jgi:hypothetical protein
VRVLGTWTGSGDGLLAGVGNRRLRGIGAHLLSSCGCTAWFLYAADYRLLNAALRQPHQLFLVTLTAGIIGTVLLTVGIEITLSWMFLRLLSRAYVAGVFSDLLYIIMAYRLLALVFPSFSLESWEKLPSILWLPIVFAVFRHRLKPSTNAPNLLVLRIFRREPHVSVLFDLVVERWRNSGTALSRAERIGRADSRQDLRSHFGLRRTKL